MTVFKIMICALCFIGSGWSAAKPSLPEKPDPLIIQHRKLFQNLSTGDRTKLLRTVKEVDVCERDALLSMVTPLVEEFPQLSENARSSILFFLKKQPETTPYRPEPNEARALSVGYLRKTLSSTEGGDDKKAYR